MKIQNENDKKKYTFQLNLTFCPDVKLDLNF